MRLSILNPGTLLLAAACFPVAVAAAPPRFDFEALQSLISGHGITRIDDLVPMLPEAFRKNYVLVYDSASLQEASRDFPRAILYGDEARLVLAFNGHEGQQGYNELETVQFREASRSFELREILFDESGSRAPVFSAPDPARCASCHFSDPRPSWEPYFIWPGAYGSEDDDLFRGSEAEPAPIEGSWYEHFLKTEKGRGRYRALAPRPAAPLANTDFGDALQKLNFMRLARKVGELPGLRPYRYALLAAVSCDGSNGARDIESFVPSSQRKKHPRSFEELYEDTRRWQTDHVLTRIRRLRAINPAGPERKRVRDEEEELALDPLRGMAGAWEIASFRYVLQGMGADLDGWSLEARTGRPAYTFITGYTDFHDLEPLLVKELLTGADEQKLRDGYPTSTDADGERGYRMPLDQLCRELRERSLRALGAPQSP